MRIADHELHGFPVVAADGIEIGRIKALLVSTESWAVEALEVRLDRDTEEDVEAPHDPFTNAVIEIPARFIVTTGDAVMLGVREDELKQLVQEQRGREEAVAEIPGYGEGP